MLVMMTMMTMAMTVTVMAMMLTHDDAAADDDYDGADNHVD